jgi:acylphosphatase
MGNENVSCNIIFKGRVQAVGFRFTASRLARAQALNGFVRNVLDGNVEVQLEGEKQSIELFIEKIRETMKRYITEMRVDWNKSDSKFVDFQIRL